MKSRENTTLKQKQRLPSIDSPPGNVSSVLLGVMKIFPFSGLLCNVIDLTSAEKKKGKIQRCNEMTLVER